MRVCVVTEATHLHGIGGMQEHTSNLVRGLVAAGHGVEVLSARHPEGLAETTQDGAIWHFIDVPGWWTRVPMRHPDWLRVSASRFVELHEQRPFDVVHSESTCALGLLQRHLERRIPIVAKFHGNYLGYLREAARRMRDGGHVRREAKGIVWTTGRHVSNRGNWHLFRRCEAMVPSFTQLEDTCRSHLLKRSRVHVVPNGIDATRFAPASRGDVRAELGLGRPGVLFVTVCRLYRGKGVRHALRALARLPGSARLVVVGDGEERASLETLVHELGLADRVTFTGAVPGEAVARYMQASDAFVFPTELPEAAPLVLPEAMGCGLPVVASRVGAIPEMADRNGEGAVLVPPGDVEALAAGMLRLFENPDLRTAMGEASRRRVLEEYTVSRMVDRTVDVYRIATSAPR